MQVINLLTSVSSQLNDQRPTAKFYRWTQTMLMSYMNTGISAITQVRQDAITYPPQTVTLVPGSEQSLPPGISSVFGFVGPGGPLVEYDNFTAAIPDDPCVVPVYVDCDGVEMAYNPLGYVLNGITPTFKIYPPVPDSSSPYTIKVTGNPGPYINSSQTLYVSDRYIPHLEAWMLYKALLVDMESATSAQASATQYKVFKDLLYGSLQAEVALKNNRALRP